MKCLKPSGFIDSIEHTALVLQNIMRFGRAPQVYRLSGSQLTEARIRLVQRNLGGNQ